MNPGLELHDSGLLMEYNADPKNFETAITLEDPGAHLACATMGPNSLILTYKFY